MAGSGSTPGGISYMVGNRAGPGSRSCSGSCVASLSLKRSQERHIQIACEKKMRTNSVEKKQSLSSARYECPVKSSSPVISVTHVQNWLCSVYSTCILHEKITVKPRKKNHSVVNCVTCTAKLSIGGGVVNAPTLWRGGRK